MIYVFEMVLKKMVRVIVVIILKKVKIIIVVMVYISVIGMKCFVVFFVNNK